MYRLSAVANGQIKIIEISQFNILVSQNSTEHAAFNDVCTFGT